MQFTPKIRRHLRVTASAAAAQELYPCAIQFYTTPPQESITLQEFEQYALERLQVLRMVEKAGLKFVKSRPEYRQYLQEQIYHSDYRSFLTHSSSVISEEALCNRRKDHISHFILRLAFCGTEELRQWFISQEVDLFRFRFSLETTPELTKFFQKNNLDYTPISAEEKEPIVLKLANSSCNISLVNVREVNYYKVPFEDALELLHQRKVYLHKGYAYIPQVDLSVIVGSHFRQMLSRSLAVTLKALPFLEEDTRLLKTLTGLDRCYVGKDYNISSSSKSGQVTPEMIDELSKTSFPPCMRSLHETLCLNHHLKHGGRMQYGLFLKGIGLSLEDALRFWKTEFTKTMAVEKFDKSYAYNIRHNYGKEGKRTSYTPYSCMKIIQGSVGPGDSYGCPFKNFDVSTLKQHLQSQHINNQGIQEILDFVSKKFYQLACTKYFELMHHGAVPPEVQHPNQYFEESRKVLTGQCLGGSEQDFKTG